MKKIDEDQMIKLRSIAVKMGVSLEELMKGKKQKAILEMIEDYDGKKFGLLNE